jgi:hypothetical protein
MKLIMKRLLSYLPSKLPVGLPQFDKWASSIIDLSGRFADDNSMRFVLASELMHSDAKKGSVPKNYFVSRCRKLAANQTAGYILQEIKAAQETMKAAEAAKAAQQLAEATAPTTEAVSASEKVGV